MRKNLAILIFLSLVLPSLVLAQTVITIQNPLTATNFEEVVNSIINFIFYVGVALAPLLIIYGAFYLLTSGGDPGRIDTGKRIISYALIGLAIVLMAKGLLAIIEQVLGVK